MNLAIAVTLVLVTIAKVSQGLKGGCGCEKLFDGSILCSHLKLETEKPFHFNETFYNFESTKCDTPFGLNSFKDVGFLHASGSIGKQTFLMIPELEALAVEDSSFEFIEDGALCSPPKLRKLHIDKIKNPPLTLSLLGNCGNLKTFGVSDRELNVEPDAFKNTTQLEKLHFGAIHIPHLTKDYLEPLVNLKSLEMHATIEKVDAGAICIAPKLEDLRIVDSNISQTLTPSMFENCQHIKQLTIVRVNSNAGEAAIEDGAFTSFTNINYVIISQQRYPRLQKSLLAGLSNAENLRITSSKIAKIDSDVFVDFHNLKYLDLGLNDLTEFDSNIIKPLSNLIKLDLTRNKLESFDNISHPVLEHLIVSDNFIKKVDVNSIRTNLPNLKKLEIGCTQIPTENIIRLKEVIPDVMEDCEPRYL